LAGTQLKGDKGGIDSLYEGGIDPGPVVRPEAIQEILDSPYGGKDPL
jgi:hypothetical protein